MAASCRKPLRVPPSAGGAANRRTQTPSLISPAGLVDISRGLSAATPPESGHLCHAPWKGAGIVSGVSLAPAGAHLAAAKESGGVAPG